MKKVFVIIVLAAVFALVVVNDQFKPIDKNVSANSIVWLGTGVNWDYQIKLSHKPNDQVQIISHGQGGIKPCVAPDYAVEISEGLIYKRHNGGQFTSFKAVYDGSPAFLNPVSEMSFGSPQGLDKGKPYGAEHVDCFTKERWERMQLDTSNTVKVTVTAYPFDNSMETISLKTAR